MSIPSFLCLGTLCAQLLTFTHSLQASPPPLVKGDVISGVRTTAYTHTEADHIEYGVRSAVGTTLKSAELRSAAADWSIYPQGTRFQIEGDPAIYVVDDYGSALVGTKTIDIYQPTKAAMNKYGTREVDIRVLSWGSRAKSLEILKPRARKAAHVRRMISRLQAKSSAA